MDDLHLSIALGPLAVYFMLLGAINLGRRPFLTTGARDAAVLGIGIAGLVIVGPMELFMPETAAAHFGGMWVWLILIGLYALLLTLQVLLIRPRLIIYNATFEELRPVLAEVVAELDSKSRWAGESLVMPQLGVQLTVEPHAVWKLVQLTSAGAEQSYLGWRKLEAELTATLRRSKGTRNFSGLSLLSIGAMLVGFITYVLLRDPAKIALAWQSMLRQ